MGGKVFTPIEGTRLVEEVLSNKNITNSPVED